MNIIKKFKYKEIFDLINSALNRKILLEGFYVKTNSVRLKCFLRSPICAFCGLHGNLWKLESTNEENPHLNLYCRLTSGKDVLLTKDHIFPKSKGGSDSLDNLQTLCIKCNEQKRDKILLDCFI